VDLIFDLDAVTRLCLGTHEILHVIEMSDPEGLTGQQMPIVSMDLFYSAAMA